MKILFPFPLAHAFKSFLWHIVPHSAKTRFLLSIPKSKLNISTEGCNKVQSNVSSVNCFRLSNNRDKHQSVFQFTSLFTGGTEALPLLGSLTTKLITWACNLLGTLGSGTQTSSCKYAQQQAKVSHYILSSCATPIQKKSPIWSVNLLFMFSVSQTWKSCTLT